MHRSIAASHMSILGLQPLSKLPERLLVLTAASHGFSNPRQILFRHVRTMEHNIDRAMYVMLDMVLDVMAMLWTTISHMSHQFLGHIYSHCSKLKPPALTTSCTGGSVIETVECPSRSWVVTHTRLWEAQASQRGTLTIRSIVRETMTRPIPFQDCLNTART